MRRYQQVTINQMHEMGGVVARRPRGPKTNRKAIDFCAPIINQIRKRRVARDSRDLPIPLPLNEYKSEILPTFAYQNPAQAFCTKYVHTSMSKERTPMNSCAWTPEGRRLISASQRGSLTLWNGKEFNFEHVEPDAHGHPIRAIAWSFDDMWLVTSDDSGQIKYWQSTMTNVKEFQGHEESIRDVTFCPTSKKFATCSDDRTICVWDFEGCKKEQVLKGHGWDVKCVNWHPTKGLLVSGSKDNKIKLWDPRSGTQVSSIHYHNNTITTLKWNPNGLWFVSGSRDHHLKVYDIRTLKPFRVFQGHKKEVTCVAWHPSEEEVFVSGGFDGSLNFWVVDQPKPQAEVPRAHDQSIWDMAWHPLGHCLATCSQDKTAKFWARNMPGDEMKDEYNIGQLPEEQRGIALSELEEAVRKNERMNPKRKDRILSGLSQIETSDALEVMAADDEVIPGLEFDMLVKKEEKSP